MLWCYDCGRFRESDAKECSEPKGLEHRRVRLLVPPHPEIERRAHERIFGARPTENR